MIARKNTQTHFVVIDLAGVPLCVPSMQLLGRGRQAGNQSRVPGDFLQGENKRKNLRINSTPITLQLQKFLARHQ